MVPSDHPRVSLIIATLNRVSTLKLTLDELLDNKPSNIEVIVIDGGSTDGSIDLLRSYGSKIDFWHSEPDDGEFFALNKGLNLAQGDIIKWIGSDDILLHDSFQIAIKHMDAHPDTEVLFGGYLVIDGRPGRAGLLFDSTKHVISADTFGLKNMLRQTKPGMQSMTAFIRKRAFEELGPFDTDYLCGDAELFARLASAGKKFDFYNAIFTHYYVTDVSTTLRKSWKLMYDHFRVVLRYGTVWDALIFVCLRFVNIWFDRFNFHPLRLIRTLKTLL